MAKHDWDNLEFRNWVRSQLQRRQWNESDFARQLGKSPSTVFRWLRGERRPDSHSCDLIADVLGVDVDLVLTLVGHRPAVAPLQPDDRRSELIALLKRVELTPDRLAGLEGTLRAWLEIDHQARHRETPGRG